MPHDGSRRRRRRLLGYMCVVVVFGAAILAWYFPARWALIWIEPQLHGMKLQQVHGSLWHGQAGRVILPDGRDLGRANWRVSRRVVYTSEPVHLRLDGPHMAFSGELRVLPHGQTRWAQVQLRADLAAWPLGRLMGIGEPSGEWQMTVNHALLQHGWPLDLDLRAQWRHAALRTPVGMVRLGKLEWTVAAADGVVDAHIGDDGTGPLQVDARLRLMPLGWRLDARLHQRQVDPALRRWLHAFGTADASGVLHVQRHGGAVLLPPVDPTVAPNAARTGQSGHAR